MARLSYFLNQFIPFISSKTARRTYMVFFGNGIAMVFAFLFTISIIRLLSISDFGYFSAIFTFLILVTDLSDIGIGNSLSRFLPPLENKKDKLFGFLKTAFILQIGIAITLSLAVFLSSSFLSNIFFHTSKYAYLFKIASLGIFATIIANFFQYALSAMQKFIHSSIVAGTGGILRFIFLLVLLPLSAVTLTNVIWTQVISFLILAMIGLFLIDIHFLRFKGLIQDLKTLLHFTFYLGTARSITAIVSRLDVLMLIAFTNSIETGIYSTASRVIAIYPLFAGSFTTVIAPKFASLSHHEELKQFMKKVVIGTLGLIVSIVILILLAYPFMTILFGEKTVPAVPVFQLLLFSMIFFVASVPAVSLTIYYLKKPHILTINSIIQLILVVGGNMLFIPRFGKSGPAFSFILAYGVTFFLTTFLSLYYYKKEWGVLPK